MRQPDPARWLAVLLVFGLISGCGGGFSKTSKSSSSRNRIPQQETGEMPGESAEGDRETPQPRGPNQQPDPSIRQSLQPTKVPTGSPYRPSDLSRLPTTINRADRSAMVLVPKGSYLVTDSGRVSGGAFGNKGALYPIPMAAFYIDRNEITVEQFKRLFSDYDETIYTGGTPCPLCPAMGITLDEAKSYCARTGKRLPTEAQWEAAGRGKKNRPYPWGKRFDTERANLTGVVDGNLKAARVGTYPAGASAFGAMDMIGNVWEWVDDGTNQPPPQPVPATTASEKTGTIKTATMQPKRVGLVKGGGYRTTPQIAILSARHQVPVDMRNPTFGFRCVKPHLGN